MQNRLTRREYVAGATTVSLGTVGLAGCLGDDDDVPGASFSFEAGDSQVTVTHDGGDSLDSGNSGALQILRTNGDEAFLEEWELPVDEGTSVTVDGRFESGQTVVVRWLTPDREEFADLATYDIE